MPLYTSLRGLFFRPKQSLFILVVFLINTIGPAPAYAQELVLPAPGQLVALSPTFSPAVLKGIQLDPKNPFRFHFFVDQGDSKLSQSALKAESSTLIKYFLASLTIPENDLWVNLSPYEKNRIVPQEFGQTEMGRDLLAEDYMLKQITASLIYPEDKIGREFWNKVYAQAQKKYGTTDIPINTFNKVWIVPDKAVVYENNGTAFVLESHLKVMLEQDYLSMTKHSNVGNGLKPFPTRTNQIASNIIRELVIPQLEHEVNYGKNFSQLRQVFYSLILATWYKNKIKDSIFNKIYSNRNKINGMNVSAGDKDKIYQDYLKAFKKGVFNYIQEEPDQITGQTIPRKYFSGGVTAFESFVLKTERKISPAQLAILDHAQLTEVSGNFRFMSPTNAAMNAPAQKSRTDAAMHGQKTDTETIIARQKEWQEHLGISQEMLVEAAEKHPQINGYTSPQRIKEQWSQELGIDAQHLAGLIMKYPQIAGYNPKHVRERWENSLGIEKDVLARLILQQPAIVGLDPEHIKDNWQREIGLGQESLIRAIKAFPSFAGRNPEHIKTLWEQELGLQKELLTKAIEIAPAIVGYNVRKNLKPKLEIIKSLNVEPSDVLSGLIQLSSKNLHLLQLIKIISDETTIKMTISKLVATYKRSNLKVKDLTGQFASYWIEENEDNKFLLEPVVREALGVGPIVNEIHLKGKQQTPSDKAQATGGINLNPVQMNMQVKKAEEIASSPSASRNDVWDYIDPAQITGVTFTIEEITPVTNLPQLLGLNTSAVHA